MNCSSARFSKRSKVVCASQPDSVIKRLSNLKRVLEQQRAEQLAKLQDTVRQRVLCRLVRLHVRQIVDAEVLYVNETCKNVANARDASDPVSGVSNNNEESMPTQTDDTPIDISFVNGGGVDKE